MTDDEKEQRDAVRADWVDSSKIAIYPTLDPDVLAARALRAQQIAYANARRERGRPLHQSERRYRGPCHDASASRQARHHVEDGGRV
jgi:hypothetical protein